MYSLTPHKCANNVPVTVEDTKRNGIRVLSQKHFGERSGLKGKALKRAHAEYRIEIGKQLNAKISEQIAKGEILAEVVNPTKTGISVSFRNPLTIKVEGTTKMRALAEKLFASGKFASVEEALKFVS